MKYKSKKINGKKVDEHRLTFERYLVRKLTKEEVVHHIDGDKSNNEIDNLMLFPTLGAHAQYHYEQGDLHLLAGNNKKKLINGKLECCKCWKIKDLKEFLTNSGSHLGVKGICRDCYNLQRRNRKS